MNVQTYNQVCPVIFGLGAAALVGEKAKELGISKALLVTDETLMKSEGYAQVTRSLEAAGIKFVVFTKITPNPKDTEAAAGAEFGKASQVDGVIALGGGSALDAAKAINLLIKNPEPLSQYYFSLDYKPLLPFISLPTTTGTGSEVTIYSVITEESSNAKKVLLIKGALAICDPELTYSLPAGLTATTGLDALAHACESITSKVTTPKSDVLSSWAIQQIFKWLPKAVAEPRNQEAKQAMMLASNFAGMGFSDTCCHIGHAAAHSLGVKFHVAHGLGCAWALPETMKYSAKYVPARAKIVAEAMGIDPAAHSGAELGQAIADRVTGLMKIVKCESIRDKGFSRQDCQSVAGLVLNDACYGFLPHPLTQAEVEDFLGAVYDSYQ
ncbi:MAG: iron-containing alcohol dehydrogenase [Candidatus Adiutrix sp.]|jgi:alcohol dehydrogenase class IV|nr:iron-containing alcohol dehydrogenase [Candidatus Adiutrix sp.]